MSEAISGAGLSAHPHVACAHAGYSGFAGFGKAADQPGALAKRQLRRFARKRNLAVGPRQNNPTGKSPETLSSPPAKNIPLNTSGKSVI
jgi:hypothetical protein